MRSDVGATTSIPLLRGQFCFAARPRKAGTEILIVHDTCAKTRR